LDHFFLFSICYSSNSGLEMHYPIYDETSTKFGLRIRSPLI
jgi:hypothetical protein